MNPIWVKEYRMTDKQIFIDGVDVSKCPDLIKEYLPSCYCSTLDKENQEASCTGCFCLFKIKQYMNNNKLIEDLKYELKCKTAEYRRSQKRISDLEERIINHSKEIEEYCIRLADKNKKCEKYEQVLDEIMKFINISTCNICKVEDTQECSECNVKTIKDIINKAKEK